MSEEKKEKVFQPYWRYHKTKPDRLIKSIEMEKALGPGWEDSPAKHGRITHPDPISKIDEDYASEESDALPIPPVADKDPADSKEAVDEVTVKLLNMGFSKKELKGKSLEELTELLGE